MKKIRTCIFCGSFDPIHVGHAMIANFVSQSGLVDELWLMPSRVNPLKTENPPAGDAERLEMCRLVARLCDNVTVSDFEMKLPAPSFTYRTLTELSRSFPDREFLLLIGSDNWLCFDRWRDHDKIIGEYQIIIYPRPGYEVMKECLPSSVTILSEGPQACISSTFIRKLLTDGGNLHFFLTGEVLNYIKQTGIYG